MNTRSSIKGWVIVSAVIMLGLCCVRLAHAADGSLQVYKEGDRTIALAGWQADDCPDNVPYRAYIDVNGSGGLACWRPNSLTNNVEVVSIIGDVYVFPASSFKRIGE